MPQKRDFKPKEQLEQHYGERTLPVHRPLIIYARQSTTGQVLNNIESARYQTEGLYQKALTHGWTDPLITLMIEGELDDGTIKGVSGTLRIDTREKLAVVDNRVLADEIGAVMCSNESRLFRDEWGIEYNTFAQHCYEHDVMILCDHYHYDFRRRPYDLDIFRRQCELAAAYNKYHIKGVLHPMRKQAALRGQYDGRLVAVGYIVDYRKLVNGEPNPTYKKFIVYEPHARVVRWIFRRYRELDGNYYQLGREIEAMGCVFSDFEGVRPSKTCLKKVPGGYMVGYNGLRTILQNPTYLGHWILEGYIVRYNNHEAIVDVDDFMYAFNRLSPYTLDGEENLERAAKTPVRYHQKGKLESPALLEHVITTPESTVNTCSFNQKWNYCITVPHYGFRSGQFETMIRVSLLDKIFVDRLMHWLSAQHVVRTLSATQADGTPLIFGFQALPNDMQEKLQEARTRTSPEAVLDSKIADYRKQLSGKVATLSLPPEELDVQTRTQFAREAKQLRGIIDELEAKKNDLAKAQAELQESSSLLERAMRDWKGMDFEEQKRFIKRVTSKVAITLIAPHWLKFDIAWDGPISYSDTGYIYRPKSAELAWTDEENAILREMYPMAERDDILQKLPLRTWEAILAQVRIIRVKRHNLTSRGSLPRNVTVQDAQFMQEHGFAITNKVQHGYVYWGQAEDEDAKHVLA